jgi:hypothetical protein
VFIIGGGSSSDQIEVGKGMTQMLEELSDQYTCDPSVYPSDKEYLTFIEQFAKDSRGGDEESEEEIVFDYPKPVKKKSVKEVQILHDSETPPLSPSISNIVESGSPVSVDLVDAKTCDLSSEKVDVDVPFLQDSVVEPLVKPLPSSVIEPTSSQIFEESRMDFAYDKEEKQARESLQNPKKKQKRGSYSQKDSPDESKSSKIAKTSAKASGISILFTKLDDSEIKDSAELLGAKIANSVKECTHLIVDKFRRNIKFFSAICEGKLIVHLDWIKASVAAGSFVDESDYILEDAEAESKYNFSLKSTLELVRDKGNGSVFSDISFFISNDCEPSKDILKEFIHAAGGKVVQKLPRTSSENFFCISGQKEKSSLIKKGFFVFSSELIFSSILRQDLDDSDRYMLNL